MSCCSTQNGSVKLIHTSWILYMLSLHVLSDWKVAHMAHVSCCCNPHIPCTWTTTIQHIQFVFSKCVALSMSEQCNPVLCCMSALRNHTHACKTPWPLLTALFKFYICKQCLLNVLLTTDELKSSAVITWLFALQDQLQGAPQQFPQYPWDCKWSCRTPQDK